MSHSVKSFVDVSGTSANLVEVECHISNGLPSILIIGYASKAVDEAKERLRASFTNSNLVMPKKRITFNLSPADLPKDSTSLDLAMAVALLCESKQIELSGYKSLAFLGELNLDGTLNPVRGLIGRLIAGKEKGIKTFYLPKESLGQALLIPDIVIKPISCLRDVYLDLAKTLPVKSITSTDAGYRNSKPKEEFIDLTEIADQPIAKRALEIAAAGHHNLLLYGPPGTGKTMLAKAICGILPDLDHTEVLEVTQLHSLGSNSFNDIVWSRPFRSPHHTASTTSLIGGGTNPKPGEASLAHRGVLFLDELPEFNRSALEALRQPLEDGYVTVSRIKDSAKYSAEFILIATQNPCPCGYYGTNKPCRCSANEISRYEKKVSGPILDRIDLHLAVNNIDHSHILKSSSEKPESPAAKKRIEDVYKIQKERFGKTKFNSSMSNKDIKTIARISPEAKDFADKAASKLDISARAYIRALKVARTIADLDNQRDVLPAHVAEALQYRKQSSLT